MAKEKINKRILIVCQHFWPESFRINDIASYLTDRDCDIDVLCGRPNYPKGKLFDGYTAWNHPTEKLNEISIYRSLEIPRGNNSNFRIFINYISFPLFSLLWVPFLLTKKYDQILIYSLSPVLMGLPGVIIGKIKRIPITTYVLDLWPENLFSVLPISNDFLRKLITAHSHWYYKRSDKLVALSSTMEKKLLEVTKKPAEAITVLPQACEKIYEEDVVDPTLVSKFGNTFNILFTGNISPAQSFETMIEAAGILKQKGYSDIKWVIVGDGMSRKEVEADIHTKGLGDLFVFEGQKPVQDIPKYTNIASVLVGCLVKSDLLEATIPAKVMSYVAAGKPITLAMDGEVQSLINNEIRCGYASETQDARALADSIEKIYQLSDEERSSLGKRAREYHLKHFERNLILNKLYLFLFSS